MAFKHICGTFGAVDHCAERRSHAVPVSFLALERLTDHLFGAGFFLGIDRGVPLGKASQKALLVIRCF